MVRSKELICSLKFDGLKKFYEDSEKALSDHINLENEIVAINRKVKWIHAALCFCSELNYSITLGLVTLVFLIWGAGVLQEANSDLFNEPYFLLYATITVLVLSIVVPCLVYRSKKYKDWVAKTKKKYQNQEEAVKIQLTVLDYKIKGVEARLAYREMLLIFEHRRNPKYIHALWCIALDHPTFNHVEVVEKYEEKEINEEELRLKRREVHAQEDIARSVKNLENKVDDLAYSAKHGKSTKQDSDGVLQAAANVTTIISNLKNLL